MQSTYNAMQERIECLKKTQKHALKLADKEKAVIRELNTHIAHHECLARGLDAQANMALDQIRELSKRVRSSEDTDAAGPSRKRRKTKRSSTPGKTTTLKCVIMDSKRRDDVEDNRKEDRKEDDDEGEDEDEEEDSDEDETEDEDENENTDPQEGEEESVSNFLQQMNDIIKKHDGDPKMLQKLFKKFPSASGDESQNGVPLVIKYIKYMRSEAKAKPHFFNGLKIILGTIKKAGADYMLNYYTRSKSKAMKCSHSLFERRWYKPTVIGYPYLIGDTDLLRFILKTLEPKTIEPHNLIQDVEMGGAFIEEHKKGTDIRNIMEKAIKKSD